MTPHSNQADIGTGISVLSAIVSISTIQPIVTLIAGLIAIVSGIMAIRYYYNVTKKVKDEIPK
jgi:hypothetical protein